MEKRLNSYILTDAVKEKMAQQHIYSIVTISYQNDKRKYIKGDMYDKRYRRR